MPAAAPYDATTPWRYDAVTPWPCDRWPYDLWPYEWYGSALTSVTFTVLPFGTV